MYDHESIRLRLRDTKREVVQVEDDFGDIQAYLTLSVFVSSTIVTRRWLSF